MTHRDPFPAALRAEVRRAAALADRLERRGLHVSFDTGTDGAPAAALRDRSGALVDALSPFDVLDHAGLEERALTAAAA